MKFTTIDVETANPDMSSICQIGVARYLNGEIIDQWVTYIEPEDYFDDINISIHGITERRVRGKPTLPQISDKLRSYLEDTVSVCHTSFDRTSVRRAFEKYNLEPINTVWLDSARVVRRTWERWAQKGYGLSNVCEELGYSFLHHDALEDAKAAGFILIEAMRESHLDLQGLVERVNRPINPKCLSHSNYREPIHRDGNPEGDLFGEVVVFTGALNITRMEAADLASNLGCQVNPGVTKKTTILVVGDQDVTKLAGHEKSIKHRKAETLAAAGQRIRIIGESDFKELAQEF